MERLTIVGDERGVGLRDGNFEVWPADIRRQNPMNAVAILDAINRLAAYEDAMTIERCRELARAQKEENLVIVVRCDDCAHFRRFCDRESPTGYCQKESETHGFCYERWEDDFCMSGRKVVL